MFVLYLHATLFILQDCSALATIGEKSGRELSEIEYKKAVDAQIRSSATTSHDHLENERGAPMLKGHHSTNWTKEQVAELLEEHGYVVKKGHGGWPLGMIGDVAYYPKDLLPEMGALHGRRNLMIEKYLWLDDGKLETVVPYYFDKNSDADQKVFEAAVKTWSDSTCIKFTKKPPNICDTDLGEAAVCVGNFGGCWSVLGRNYVKGRPDSTSQKMSVAPSGCEDVAAAHEFGHALGLMHEQSRPDRDEHIHVIYENLGVEVNKIDEGKLKNLWTNGEKLCPSKMLDVPKPYDPMSLMHYATSDFAGNDARPVYVHRNPHYQYMFDYHRSAGYIQSHYDKFIVNMGYKCVEKWKKDCEASGKSVPKCQNYGYLGKECKCLCPAGFSGDTCGTKDGPIFPVLDRAKAMLDISEPGLVDMKGKGMHDENHNYPKESFTKWQYITVIIKSGKEQRISVEVRHNFTTIQDEFESLVDTWFNHSELECLCGLAVYVGHSETRRLRTECVSSMVNNEVKEYRPVLRSRTSELDIVGIAGWGLTIFGRSATIRMVMEFQFLVSFHDQPELKLDVKQKRPGKVAEAVERAAKMTQETFNNHKVLVIVALVLVVIGLTAAGGLFAYRRVIEVSDPPDKPEGSQDSSSGDESSDSSDKDRQDSNPAGDETTDDKQDTKPSGDEVTDNKPDSNPSGDETSHNKQDSNENPSGDDTGQAGPQAVSKSFWG